MSKSAPDLAPVTRVILVAICSVLALTATHGGGLVRPAILTALPAAYLGLTSLIAGTAESAWTRVGISYLDIVLAATLQWASGGHSSAWSGALGGLVALASVRRRPWIGFTAGGLGSLCFLAACVGTGHIEAVTSYLPQALLVGTFGLLGTANARSNSYHEDANEDARPGAQRILEDAQVKARDLAEQKARKEAELYDKTRKLETLINVSHHLTTARRPSEVMQLVVSKAKDELNATFAFACLVKGESLVVVQGAGSIHDHTTRALAEKVGQGLLGEAVAKDRTLRCLAGDPALVSSPLSKTPDRVRTLLLVPLKGPQDKAPFGLLGVANVLVGDGFSDQEEGYLRILATDSSIAIKNIALHEGLRRSYDEMIHALAQAIEAKDPYTHGHVGRVQETATRLARSMRLPDEAVEIISKAAILHDVGKISTPNDILNKPGALTPNERRKMDDHVTSSIHILKDIASLPDEVFEMVLYHHERFDGRGYPYGLRGLEIPVGAQIISVADAFDAMTSDRPYRKGFPLERALELLKQSAGSQFNDVVVAALLNMLDDRLAPSTRRMKSLSLSTGTE